MDFKHIITIAILLVSTSNLYGALIDRGNGLIYDNVLDITWLQNANLADTNTFGVTPINFDGKMQWDAANEWITAMNLYNGTGYKGLNDWRLPTLTPVNGTNFQNTFMYNGSTDNGYNISAPDSTYPSSTASEMGYMYYTNLDNKGVYDIDGNFNSCAAVFGGCLENSDLFVNLVAGSYWSGLQDPSNPSDVFAFNFGAGGQGTPNKGISNNVWAVHDGDIGAVPIPAALWLFGSGLLGLIGFSKRKKQPN